MVRKRSNVAQTLRPSFPLSTLGSKESSKLKVIAWAAGPRLNFAKEFEGANVSAGKTYQNLTAVLLCRATLPVLRCAARCDLSGGGPRAYVIHRHARSVEAAFDRPERQLASSAGSAKD